MPLRWFPVAVSAVVLGWVLLRVVVACAGLPTCQVSDLPTFRVVGMLAGGAWVQGGVVIRVAGVRQ